MLGTGVWDVVVLPNDDIASISQDGALRIWTRNPDRWVKIDVRSNLSPRYALLDVRTQFQEQVLSAEQEYAEKEQKQKQEAG